MVTEDGKKVDKASDMETWYAERAKFLCLSGDYEQCMECCDRALARFSAFHHNNDGWIKYRKAQALVALGNPEEAGKIIQDIQAHGLNHWCLYQLLYEMDVSAGRSDDAMIHAAMCALADQSHEMRVGFYSDYADFLDAAGHPEEAALHRHLVLLIRNEKAWSLKQVHMSWVIPPETEALNKQETLNKLKKFWFDCRDRNVSWLTGSIVRLLSEGKSGFVDPWLRH